MSRLVALYGDDAQLESALNALTDVGLADKARVVGGGSTAGEFGGAATDEAAADRAAHEDGPLDAGIAIPAAAGAGNAAAPASPAVLAPLAVPPGGSRAVGVVGEGPGTLDTSRELERITGGDADETRFYEEALEGGASLLVVEGSDSELDRAEAALQGNEGQGMVRR